MYLSLASPFLLHGCLFIERIVRRDDSTIQLFLDYESICDSEHGLVQMAVGWRDGHGKDWVGIAITKRDRDIITDLVAAQREPGNLHWSSWSDFWRPVSTPIAGCDKAEIELELVVT